MLLGHSSHCCVRSPSRSFSAVRPRRRFGASTFTSGIHDRTQRTSSLRPVVSIRISTRLSSRVRNSCVGCHCRSVMETASFGSNSSLTLIGSSPPAMPKACRAYVSGQNSAGRVKVCPVAAICLNRDRAKVSTRALAVFSASVYQFPW